jgi:uncharacterized protein YxjI
MSKLYIKEKVSGDTKDFEVKDELGKSVYHVVETGILPTPKYFKVENGEGEEIGKITRKRFNFLPRYYVHLKDREEISIIKDMVALKTIYKIEGEGLSIDGDWLSKNFSVCKDEKQVAKISEQKGDDDTDYEIEILDESLEDLIICFIVVITFVHTEE